MVLTYVVFFGGGLRGGLPAVGVVVTEWHGAARAVTVGAAAGAAAAPRRILALLFALCTRRLRGRRVAGRPVPQRAAQRASHVKKSVGAEATGSSRPQP